MLLHYRRQLALWPATQAESGFTPKNLVHFLKQASPKLNFQNYGPCTAEQVITLPSIVTLRLGRNILHNVDLKRDISLKISAPTSQNIIRLCLVEKFKCQSPVQATVTRLSFAVVCWFV